MIDGLTFDKQEYYTIKPPPSTNLPKLEPFTICTFPKSFDDDDAGPPGAWSPFFGDNAAAGGGRLLAGS